jgi:hypothetical protein
MTSSADLSDDEQRDGAEVISLRALREARAASSHVLAFGEAQGKMMATLARIDGEMAEMRRELAGLRTAVQSALVRMIDVPREKVPSAHEIAVEVAEEITSPGVNRAPTTSDRVRDAIAADKGASAVQAWKDVRGAVFGVLVLVLGELILHVILKH